MTVASPLLARHLEVLMANAWFASLPEPVRADILGRGRVRVLAPGKSLYRRGDTSDGVFAVLEGVIRMGGISSEGREAVLDYFEPGAWIGEVSMLDGGPRIHDATAFGPTVVLQVRAEDFELLLARHPALSRMLLTLEAQRLRLALDWIQATATWPLEHRLASRLLLLATRHRRPGAPDLAIELPLTQEALAQLVGVTRQRVNQLLKAWAAEGIVAYRPGRVLVLDREKLEVFARIA